MVASSYGYTKFNSRERQGHWVLPSTCTIPGGLASTAAGLQHVHVGMYTYMYSHNIIYIRIEQTAMLASAVTTLYRSQCTLDVHVHACTL